MAPGGTWFRPAPSHGVVAVAVSQPGARVPGGSWLNPDLAVLQSRPRDRSVWLSPAPAASHMAWPGALAVAVLCGLGLTRFIFDS